MVDEIITGIALALKEKFGTGYKVHRERERQNLEDHAFFVSCYNQTHSRVVGRRFFRQFHVVIHYFPADKLDEDAECSAVAEGLYDCLEWISISGDLQMANNMRHEMVDGVLNFFVDYTHFVCRDKDDTPMETLTLNQEVKE